MMNLNQIVNDLQQTKIIFVSDIKVTISIPIYTKVHITVVQIVKISIKIERRDLKQL